MHGVCRQHDESEILFVPIYDPLIFFHRIIETDIFLANVKAEGKKHKRICCLTLIIR